MDEPKLGLLVPEDMTKQEIDDPKAILQPEEADCCGLIGNRGIGFTYVRIGSHWHFVMWAEEKRIKNARGGWDITTRTIGAGPDHVNVCMRCAKPLNELTESQLRPYKWGIFPPLDQWLRTQGLRPNRK